MILITQCKEYVMENARGDKSQLIFGAIFVCKVLNSQANKLKEKKPDKRDKHGFHMLCSSERSKQFYINFICFNHNFYHPNITVVT